MTDIDILGDPAYRMTSRGQDRLFAEPWNMISHL